MKKLFVALVLLAAVIGGYLWWGKSSATPQTRILATERIDRGTVRKVLEETGIVKSQVGGIVKIGARATGTIERMLVKVGDQVEKGQLVASIDNRELRSQIAEAGARLDAARAELARVQKITPLRIAEAESELELARARAAYSRSTFERQSPLVAERVISLDELEKVRQQAEIDASQIRARAATLDRERKDLEQEGNKARLAVAQAEAALKALQVRLSYTDISSPLTGTVSNVTGQEGEMIVTGLQVANLITVIDPSRLEMWIYVDETDVGMTQSGQSVEFRVDAYPGKSFSGEISTIYPEPEIRDNIVYYRALVDIDREQAALLRPEMTTQVQIVVEEKSDVLRLPNAALKWVNGNQLVFVQEPGGEVRKSTPELGLAGLGYSEVTSGLSEGDQVAVQVDLGEKSPRRKTP